MRITPIAAIVLEAIAGNDHELTGSSIRFERPRPRELGRLNSSYRLLQEYKTDIEKARRESL